MEQYQTQVIELNNEYICLIEELGLITKGRTLDEAYSAISIERSSYLEKMKDCNLETYFARVDGSARGKEEVKLFILKSLIITVLCILLFGISGFVGGMSLKRGFNLVQEKVIERSSTVANLSEEEKLELFKSKLNTMKPYFVELKKTLND